MRRIGALIPFAEGDTQAQIEITAFRDALRQPGWVEGSTAQIDYRWAGSNVGQLRTLAKELVTLRPDVILARSTPVTTALLQETRTIPIVFVVVSDPVGDGLVASLARPGGNVTGFTNVGASFGSKWLQLLKEIYPPVAQVAVMYNPKTAHGGYLSLIEDAARSIPVKVVATAVQDPGEIERAIVSLAHDANGALLVLPDITTYAHRDLIVQVATRNRLPAIYVWPLAAEAGGLMSYGIDYVDQYQRAASYVDRILNGAKPSDLPVQQASKFQFVINLKAAKALGLTIPQSLLLRADTVIQ